MPKLPGFDILTQRPRSIEADQVIQITERDSPFVLSVPHGGTWIPAQAMSHIEHSRLILIDTDMFTQQAYAGVAELGSSVMTQVDPYVVNCNRGYTKPENPIVPTSLLSGQATLLKPYTAAQRRAIIARFYTPYHDALTRLLARAVKKYGFAFMLDGHGMDRYGMVCTKDPGERRLDMVVGDHKGAAANIAIVQAVLSYLRSAGYNVGLNAPYSGGHITRAFGNPSQRVHVIQIETVKQLYMRPLTTPAEAARANIATTSGLKPLQGALKNALQAGLRAAAVV